MQSNCIIWLPQVQSGRGAFFHSRRVWLFASLGVSLCGNHFSRDDIVFFLFARLENMRIVSIPVMEIILFTQKPFGMILYSHKLKGSMRWCRSQVFSQNQQLESDGGAQSEVQGPLGVLEGVPGILS